MPKLDGFRRVICEVLRGIGFRPDPTRAVFGNGIFVGSRYRGRLLVSTDAITWEESTKVAPNMESIAFGKLGPA